MPKNVIISEGGRGRRFPNVSRLITDKRNGMDSWVPTDDRIIIPKYISKNGIFYAKDDNAYGYSKLTVNIPGGAQGTLPYKPASGTVGSVIKAYDASTMLPTTYAVDNNGFIRCLGSEIEPQGIRIVQPPNNTTCTHGKDIDYTGMVVMAVSSDGSPYEVFPDGIIPNNMLELQQKADLSSMNSIGTGTNVPSKLVPYIGESPKLVTLMDVAVGNYATHTDDSVTGIRSVLYNSAIGCISIVDYKSAGIPSQREYDGHVYKSNYLSVHMYVASLEPFDFSSRRYSYKNGNRVYANKNKGEENIELGNINKFYSSSDDYRFVYDLNGQLIYMANYNIFKFDGYNELYTNPLLYIDDIPAFESETQYSVVEKDSFMSINTSGINWNPLESGFWYKTPYGLESTIRTYDYIQGQKDNNPQKIYADIGKYLLFGSKNLNDYTVPVSWTTYDGRKLTTNLNLEISIS